MAEETDFVTVFRSADSSAEEEAVRARDLLAEAGIDAVLLADETPGVMAGCFEVRVPAEEASRSELLLSSMVLPAPDASHDMDLATVFRSAAANAELEATEVQRILEASDIPAVLVGASQLPSLPFEVRVPGARLEEAQQLLEDAKAAGPEAAEQAEAESEGVQQPPL